VKNGGENRMVSSSEPLMEQVVEIPQADSDAPDHSNFDDLTGIFYRALELLPEVLDSAIGLLK